jgi:hypothetical protein
MKTLFTKLTISAFVMGMYFSANGQIYLPANQNSSSTNSTIFGDDVPQPEAKVEVNVAIPQEYTQEGGIRINVSSSDQLPDLPPDGPESSAGPMAFWVNHLA